MDAQCTLWSLGTAHIRRTCIVALSSCYVGTYSGLFGGDWEPSPLGGSDVQRPLRIYAADYSSSGISKAGACTKHQRSNMKLIPGCFLFWCMDCGKCVGWNLMHRYALAVPHVNVAELFGALMIS